MNPEAPTTSDWMQPVRPIRILFQAGDAEHRHFIYIFALRTAGSECEYLTIDGIFIQARSRSVMFAETLIDGHWLRLGPKA
jgi:hypothetical protein